MSTRKKILKDMNKEGFSIEIKSVSYLENGGLRALVETRGDMSASLQTYYESNRSDFISAIREIENKAAKEMFYKEPDIPLVEDSVELPEINEELDAVKKVKDKLKPQKKKVVKKKKEVVKKEKQKGVFFDRSNDEHKSIAIGVLCDFFGDSWIGDEEKTSKIREFNDQIEGKEIIILEDGSISETFKELYKNEFAGVL